MKLNNEKGSILTMFALLLPMIFSFVGLAYDTGFLYMQKAYLQNVSDSASLAGMISLRDVWWSSDKYEIENVRLVLAVPDNAVLVDDYEENHIVDSGADNYLRVNSNNDFSINDKLSNSGRVFTHLYKVTDTENNKKVTYYYKVITSKEYGLFFMRVLDINTSWVGAEAISCCERTEKTITKDWYHMFRWELAQITSEERLLFDQQSLIKIAKLFIGKTTYQARHIINNHPDVSDSFLIQGHEVLILNYRDNDNDDTVINTQINFSDSRAPQTINWTRDDYGEFNETLNYIPISTYNPELGHFEDMRFFFSDWMLQAMPSVDSNRRSIRISFKVENGVISEARVRVNRSRNYLHELDVTVKSNGYEGKTNPDKTGSYTDNRL